MVNFKYFEFEKKLPLERVALPYSEKLVSLPQSGQLGGLPLEMAGS